MKKFGLNLRLEWLDSLLGEGPDINGLQIIVDNWFSDGPHHQKLEKLRQNYEISFHCVGMNVAGYDPLNRDYLKRVQELILRYQPLEVSDHLAVQKHQDVCFHDLLPFALNQASLSRVEERVDHIQSFLGRQLLVENLSSYILFEDSTYQESEFLKRLTAVSGCGVLLDIHNIYANSLNHHNFDPEKEIMNMPLDHVREMHVAGGDWMDGVYVDTHGQAVPDEVLKLLFQIEPHCSNATVFYERDRNLPPLYEAVQDVQAIRDRIVYRVYTEDSKPTPLSL